MFQKAIKTGSTLKMAIQGPSGAGKTYTALQLATRIVERERGKIALIDTEGGSASKYADLFDFDTAVFSDHNPEHYTDAIQKAAKAGYTVLIIDSFSHVWTGTGGALEMVDGVRKKFTQGWKEVTPLLNKLNQTIVNAPLHIIATMRTKTEYVIQANEAGKAVPVEVGTKEIQRDGVKYEFDVVGEISMGHVLRIAKTRCPDIAGQSYQDPTDEPIPTLLGWLSGDPIDEATLKQFHDVGHELYGNGWSDKKTELTQAITKGRTNDTTKLTLGEMRRLITGMESKITAQADDTLRNEQTNS